MVSRRGSWLFIGGVAFSLLLEACGSPSAAPAGDVTGAWCGIDVVEASACLGDEVIYAEFTQSAGATGQVVTGMSCEYYNAGSGCYDIQGGGLNRRDLAFFYTFGVDRVDAHLVLSDDALSLVGAYTSTKCSCDIPVTLHRLP